MFQSLDAFRNFLESASNVVSTVLPKQLSRVVVGYTYEHQGMSLLWQLLKAQRVHSETQWVGFVVPGLSGWNIPGWNTAEWNTVQGDYYAFLHSEMAHVSAIEPTEILDGAPMEIALVAYEDVNNGTSHNQVLALRISLAQFWEFLAEPESPLMFLVSEGIGEYRARGLRNEYRSQYTNYAIRKACAGVAELKRIQAATWDG